MANNRLYLVHEPSGLAVGLGKRMGWGWFVGRTPASDHEELMNRFYDLALAECEQAGDQDRFIVVLETDNSWEVAGTTVSPGISRFMRVIR